MNNRCFLGLGSNLGDKKENLRKAKELLIQKNIKIINESTIYETKPMYYSEQDNFLNQVIEVKTDYQPDELLEIISEIEKKLKRVRKIKYGPRTIDIDILFYGDKIIMRENLIIPHHRIIEREFVLEPLCEIAGDFIHPEHRKTMCELKEELIRENRKTKFLCDAMLGDIAEWLRLTGFFVFYNPDADDNELVRLSSEKGYILLTRDKELSKRKNINALYIESKEFKGTIREIFKKLKLSIDEKDIFSRCPICGEKLIDIDKDEVKLFIPIRIYEEHDKFKMCRKCEKIYWKGEKYKNLYNQYLEIKDILE